MLAVAGEAPVAIKVGATAVPLGAEEYLGTDACRIPGDQQLRGYIWDALRLPTPMDIFDPLSGRGVQRHQGEVLGKKDVLQAYRSNATAVLSGQMAFDPVEWQEMKAILDLVLHAFDDA